MPPKSFVKHLSWALLFCIQTIQAQEKYKFQPFFSEDGLSQSTITSVIQDYKGFIWIGTPDGLNRFDGYSFKIYKSVLGVSTTLLTNHVTALFQDSRKNLWIGTAKGLCLYNRERDEFEHIEYAKINYLAGEAVRSITESEDSVIWIGGWQGVSYVDLIKRKIISFTPGFSSVENKNGVVDLTLDKDQNLWAATKEGLEHYNKAYKKFVSYTKNLPSNDLRCLLFDHDNNLWIGSGTGLYVLRSGMSDFEAIPEFQNFMILDLIQRKNRLMLIGTERGCFLFDPSRRKSIQHITKENTQLSDNSIQVIYEDNNLHLWLGTFKGLNLSTQYKFDFLGQRSIDKPGLKASHVLSVLKDDPRQVWVGTEKGIDIIDLSTSSIEILTQSHPALSSITKPVLSLTSDRSNNVWISTWPDGIYHYNKQTKRVTEVSQKASDISEIAGMVLHDKDETIWIGTLHGLFRFNQATNELKLQQKIKDIDRLFKDSKGNLWISTPYGLWHYNPQTKVANNYSEQLEAVQVGAILEDEGNVYWIGTEFGLIRFFNNTFENVSNKSDFPNVTVKGLLDDHHGNLWVSTNNGVFRLNKQNYAVHAFTIADGLQGKEFWQNAAVQLDNNKMMFAGTKGLNVFNPDSMHYNQSAPPVVLTDFKVLNKPVPLGKCIKSHISVADEIQLNYTDTEFSFEFVALNFSSTAKNLYAYKMEGFDKDWIYSGSRRFASYTNLPPGKNYIFKVKASNNDGVWNEKGVSIKIYITPPFWETWWFKLSTYTTTALIAFLIFRIRSVAHRKQKIKLQKEVNERTTELRQANEMLKAQAEEIENINALLKQDNIKLEYEVKDLSQARIMQKRVSFEEFKNVYPDNEACYRFIEALKWGEEFKCVKCSNTKYSVGKTEFSRRCSKCNHIETITANTIFSGIKFPITKAFYLLFLVSEGKHYTAAELSGLLDLRLQTCWSFKKRIEERTKDLSLQKNKDGWSHFILID